MVVMRNIRLPELDKNCNVDQQKALVFESKTTKYNVILGADFLTKTGIDVKYSTAVPLSCCLPFLIRWWPSRPPYPPSLLSSVVVVVVVAAAFFVVVVVVIVEVVTIYHPPSYMWMPTLPSNQSTGN
jgi:hypothetical protein